jgi:hypothetical protein
LFLQLLVLVLVLALLGLLLQQRERRIAMSFNQFSYHGSAIENFDMI